jgi:hypothetical protein
MPMGKRKQRQKTLFILCASLPQSDSHPFSQKLNTVDGRRL